MSTPDKNKTPPSESAPKKSASKAGEKTEANEASKLGNKLGKDSTANGGTAGTSLTQGEPTPDDAKDFDRLDSVVREGLLAFFEVGNAFAEIRERELWKAGGFSSWAAYCKHYQDLSKTHANRLITSSQICDHLRKVTPIGVTGEPVLPTCEAQVRPLHQIKDPDQWGKIWNKAVERAGGGVPTAKIVTEVAAEVVPDKDPPPPPTPPIDKVVKALTALIGNVDQLIEDDSDPAEGEVEQIGQLSEKLGTSLRKLLPTIAPMVVPAVPGDPVIEEVEDTASPLQEPDTIDEEASTPPNNMFLKKWVTMISEIRGGLIRKRSESDLVELLNMLEQDIRSAE